MKMRSKVYLGIVAGALGLLVSAAAAADTSYPGRAITIVTPTAAGGGTDVVARLIGEKIAPLLKQPVVVSNKPGAGGVVGTQGMLREKNDGYTLMVTANSNQLIVPWIYKGAKFDPIEDFEPVALLGKMPFVLTVNPNFPAQNLEQFLDILKKEPGHYHYASAGSGTLNHLIPEMLMQRAQVSMEHIPYRGGAPAVTDVLGNQVPIYFGSLPSILEHIRAGKLRALAVASESRSEQLPDVPAISETLPGFESDLWVALYAPKGTPESVIEKLNQAVQEVMKDPEVIATYTNMGMVALYEGPQALDKRQREEFKAWGEVVTAVGVTVD